MPVIDWYQRAVDLGIVKNREEWARLESIRNRLLMSGAYVIARDGEPVIGYVAGFPVTTGAEPCP